MKVKAKLADIRQGLRTVRGRSALFAGIVVAVVLAAGMAVILVLYRGSLESNLNATLRQQAEDRAQLVSTGTDPTQLVATFRDESLVWIGTADGTALATGGSLRLTGSPFTDVVAITDVPSGSSVAQRIAAEFEELDEGTVTEIETESLQAGIARSTDGTILVVAAAESEVIDKALGPLLRLFAVALPVAALGVALLAWNTAGRALRPVDDIRRESDRISGSNLSGRVPLPEGQDEIHELAGTMNEMLERLETHQRSLRQFTSDASHELKSPVANIQILAETASVNDEAWPDLRDRIVSETTRLKDLVGNLLYLASHDEAKGTAAERQIVHLDDLLFDEAEAVSATADLRIDIGGVGPAEVLGVRSDLRRLARNLVDNAARHAATTVHFTTCDDNTSVSFTVSNDGESIPHELRDRIFERFARIDDARDRNHGGTGLGLAIVKQIVEQHGGTIAVEDWSGGGTTMRVRLPKPTV